MEREDKRVKNGQINADGLHSGRCPSQERTAVHWPQGNAAEGESHEDEKTLPVRTLSEIHENAIFEQLVGIKEAQRKWIENSRSFGHRRSSGQRDSIKDVTDKFNNLSPRKSQIQDRPRLFCQEIFTDDKSVKASGDLTSNKPPPKKSIITPTGSSFGFCNVPHLKLHPSPVTATTFEPVTKPDKEYISEDGKLVKVLKIEEPNQTTSRPNKEKNPKKTKLVDTSVRLTNDPPVKKAQLVSDVKKFEINPVNIISKVETDQPKLIPSLDDSTNSLITKLNQEIKKVSELVEQTKKLPKRCETAHQPEPVKKTPKKGKSSLGISTKKVTPEKENVLKANTPKQKKYDLKVTRNFIKQKKKEREERSNEEKKRKALESEERKKKLLELKETQRKILQTCKRRVIQDKPQWIGPLEVVPKEKKEIKIPMNRRSRGPGTVTFAAAMGLHKVPAVVSPNVRNKRQLFMDYNNPNNTQRIIRQNTEIIRRNRPVDIPNKGDYKYAEDPVHPDNFLLSTSDEISSLKTCKSESALKSSDTSFVNYTYIDYSKNFPTVQSEQNSSQILTNGNQKRIKSNSLSPLDPLKNVDQALKGEKRLRLNYTEDSKASLKLPMTKFLEAVPWESPLNENLDRPRTPFWLKDLSEDPDPFNLINTFKRKLQLLDGEDRKERDSVQMQQNVQDLNVHNFALDMASIPQLTDRTSKLATTTENFINSLPQLNFCDATYNVKELTSPNKIGKELVNLSADKINKYSLIASMPEKQSTHAKKGKSKSATRAKKQQMVPEADIIKPQISKSDTSLALVTPLKLSDSLECLNLRYQKLITGETIPQKDDGETDEIQQKASKDCDSKASPTKCEKKKSTHHKKERTSKKNVLVRASSEEFPSKPDELSKHSSKQKGTSTTSVNEEIKQDPNEKDNNVIETICSAQSENYATLSEYSSNQSGNNMNTNNQGFSTFHGNYSCMAGMANDETNKSHMHIGYCSNHHDFYPVRNDYSSTGVNYSKYMINMSPYGNVPAGQYVYPQNVGAYSMNNANIAVCSANQQDMYSYSQMAGYVPAMYQSMSGSYGTTPVYMAGSSGTAAHAAPIPTAIVTQTPVMIAQESAAGSSRDVNTTLPVIMTAEKAAKAREKIIQKVYSESIFSDNSSDSVSEMVQLSRTLTRGNTVINNEVHRVTSQSVKAKAEADGISEIMEVTSLRSSIHDPPFDFEEGSSIDKNITFTSIETYSPNTYEERPLEMKIAKITSQFDEPNDSRTAEQNYRSLNSYETSLIKKAKACIEEMESRRLKLIGKGKDSEASILKKKERALMLKLYEDLKEIFRLRKLEKSAGKNKKTKEDLMQVVPSQLKKDLAKVISSSNMKGDAAESPDLVLLQTSRQLKEKEELLKERKKNVEAIVAWKQKLEQEERRVREMESLIARSPFNAPIQTFASFPCTIDRGTSPLGLEMPIENLGQGENVKQLCLMDSDNQNEYSDSFEMSSGLSEHTMKNVTVRSRHSSRVQYKRKPMTILKSPLSPRVTILKRRYSTGSDESITLSQNDTLSEQSDMEIRVSALQHQLKQRKNELEKLRKEYHKSQRERLRAKEQSLISQIHAYDSYIEQVKNELQNELEKPDVKVTKPQIKQPKYNEKKKSDANKITSASSEVVSSVTSQVEQTSKISEVKEEKPTPEIIGSLESATSTKSHSSVPEQISAQVQEVIDIAHQMITSGSPVSDISTVLTQSQTKTSMQEISEYVEQATLPMTNPESDLKEVTENIPSSIPSKSSSSPIKEVSENLDASFATKSEAEISERIEVEEDTSEETIVPEVKESSVHDETKAGIEESHMSSETKESNEHNTEVKTASSFKAIHDISTSPTNQTTISSMIPTESKFRSYSPESHTTTNIISELIGSYGTETGSGRFSSISPESINLDEISEHFSKKSNDTNDQKFHSKASSSDTPTCIPSEESKTKPTESVKTLTPEKSPQSNVKSISEQLEKDTFLNSLRESLSEYSPTFQTEEGSKRTISQFLEEKHSPSHENKSFTLSSGEMSVASSYTNCGVDHEFDEVETASENKNQQSQSVFSVPEELSTIQPNLSQSSPGKKSDEKSVAAASSPPSFPASKSYEISEAIAEESGKDNHEEIEEVYDESLSVESETEVIDSLEESSSHSSKRFSDQGEANVMEVANDVKTNPRERLSEEVFDLIHNSFELSDKLWKENMEQYEKNPEETPLLSALQRERQQNVNVDYIIQVICTNIINEATDAAIAAFDKKKNFMYSQAESFPLAENEGITVGRNEKNNDGDMLWHGEGLTPQAVKEAQELRLKQLQIEQEIEKLEAQEVVPYYYVREIPNKPPPPYTPPKHSPPTKEETLSRLSQGVEIIWDEESKGNDPASVQMPESFLSTIQDHSYREFMFDLAKETFLKFKPRPEAAKPPWVVAHPPRKPLPPIRTKADLLKFVNKEGNIIFGYEPKIIKENMIMRWTKKRRDLVDEILVKELQEEEGEWTNFSYEENLVKNQIADSLIETMVAEASHGIAAAFMKKFPNVDAPS
ncbi:uncharacterized protein LOC106673789 isoform X2 [Cimex lectularius]|uniref:Uncharacterized protein n=1 Tax=Cimex lectularius TaxID=79782 RepID=A0A8I6S8T0_CIMLE|nr:uncharacterized protein LOC106673789 isoform X2 [Cimex lectularius]